MRLPAIYWLSRAVFLVSFLKRRKQERDAFQEGRLPDHVFERFGKDSMVNAWLPPRICSRELGKKVRKRRSYISKTSFVVE
jgi:hypothetical protein